MIKTFKFLILSLLITTSAYGNIDSNNVETIKKAIVTINARISVSAYQNAGDWSGTGFVADKNNGFIITNAHVVGRANIGTYFVTFYNGQQSEAKVLYYDSYADFAILKVNPEEFPTEIQQIEFTEKKGKLGQEIFIVGNTEGQGFSFHNGHISDLFDINGGMPQGSYVINMNSTGGSSGSPILNAENKAIGVLYGGGKTHVLALKQSYVVPILKALQTKTIIKRKHIGILTELYSLDKAVKHRNFPKGEKNRYIKKFPDTRNRVVAVRSILPGSTGKSIILPGDILWQVNGQDIAGDLTILDEAMNNANDSIKLTIYRNGKKLVKQIKLYDLEKNKITKILDFAGALFFTADDFVAAKSGIPINNVTAVNINTGSSFSTIPERYIQDYKNIYRIVIKSIDNRAINSLDDLIMAVNSAINKKYVSIAYQNYQPYVANFNLEISAHENLVYDITFDSIDNKPRILQYDHAINNWISREL